MTTVLNEIIELLTAGLTQMAAGIGGGLSALASEIFLTQPVDGGAQTLSVFGGLIVIFAGISLCIGLSRLVFFWLTSLGN